MSAIEKNPDFAVINRAVINDPHIRELSEKLAEIYTKSMPKIVLEDQTVDMPFKIRMEYDPDIEALAGKIKSQIDQRKEQIIKQHIL